LEARFSSVKSIIVNYSISILLIEGSSSTPNEISGVGDIYSLYIGN